MNMISVMSSSFIATLACSDYVKSSFRKEPCHHDRWGETNSEFLHGNFITQNDTYNATASYLSTSYVQNNSSGTINLEAQYAL